MNNMDFVDKFNLITMDNYVYKEFMYKKVHIATIQDDGIYFIPSYKYMKLIYKIVEYLNGNKCYIMLNGVYNLDLYDYDSNYINTYNTIIKLGKYYYNLYYKKDNTSHWFHPFYEHNPTYNSVNYEDKLELEFNVISNSLFHYLTIFNLNKEDIENASYLHYGHNTFAKKGDFLDRLWSDYIFHKNTKKLEHLFLL